MKRVARVLQPATNVFGLVSTLLISLIAIPMIYDVALRTWGRPTVWVYEVTTYILLAGTFLANAQTLRDGKHFQVTFLLKSFPVAAPFLKRFAMAATVLFGFVVFYSGAKYALEALVEGQRSATILHVPLFWPRLAIPVGALGLIFQSLAALLTGEFPADHEAHT
jgi:C4-dicarboxylate transporter, DctQ subunit